MDMTHKIASDTLTPKQLRQFGMILAGGLILIFGLLIPWIKESPFNLLSWPWIVGAFLLLISLAVPSALKPVYKVWMAFGGVMGFINTRIILGLIFLAIFTPVALALKLLRKDPMSRKLDAARESYRISSQQPKTENLNRPY